MSMTPNAPIVNEPEIVTPYRKEGDRLTPILTPTDASLVSYENTSPEAEFKGTNMKEALDTLFDRMPAMPDNGQKILASNSSTSTDWTVPQGVYECLCVLISPGGRIGMYDSGYHPGGYCLSFRMPTTPGTVLSMVIQGGRVSSGSVFHAGITYKDNPNKLYSYAYTPEENTPSWNNTFPGAEVIFSSRAGKSYMHGSGSSNRSKNLQGGAFRIKNNDLAHFALYGGTSAYKTPTDAIKSSSPGVSVSGPSGARAGEDGYDGFGVATYSYMTPDLHTNGGLVAVLWGPQIHV